MNKEMIIKAWKNEQYRHTLSVSEQASLPAHPAGLVDLDDAVLGNVSGAEEVPSLSIVCSIVAFSIVACISLVMSTCKTPHSHGCCATRM